MDSLDAVNFFGYINKKDDYRDFKAAYAEFAAIAAYTAPYAEYLYGRSLPEPVDLKARMSRYAGYGEAIGRIMPDSTLVNSPSFAKLVSSSAANTILSGQTVEAYVTAYRTFIARLVSNKLSLQIRGNDMAV
jgi:hypothetical protein